MRIDMPPLRRGNQLLVSLGLLLTSCRDSVPPKIEVCIGDGVGGADCVEADGSQKYRLPSELKNYWMTGQPDMQNFSSWCYDATPSAAQAGMQVIYQEAKR
jgi:hypothetical protein